MHGHEEVKWRRRDEQGTGGMTFGAGDTGSAGRGRRDARGTGGGTRGHGTKEAGQLGPDKWETCIWARLNTWGEIVNEI